VDTFGLIESLKWTLFSDLKFKSEHLRVTINNLKGNLDKIGIPPLTERVHGGMSRSSAPREQNTGDDLLEVESPEQR
jgi:hypothetical protein